MMNGRDFKDFIYQSVQNNSIVLFVTEDGNFHKVHAAIRTTRMKECPSVILLCELGAIARKYSGELSVPPKELIDYLNEHC